MTAVPRCTRAAVSKAPNSKREQVSHLSARLSLIVLFFGERRISKCTVMVKLWIIFQLFWKICQQKSISDRMTVWITQYCNWKLSRWTRYRGVPGPQCQRHRIAKGSMFLCPYAAPFTTFKVSNKLHTCSCCVTNYRIFLPPGTHYWLLRLW